MIQYKKNVFLNDNGSAIITVIIFITVALLFITSILLYQRQESRMIISYSHDIQTSYNTKSVLPLAIYDFQKQMRQNNIKTGLFTYSLFEKDTTSAIIEPWGLYLLCKTSSRIRKSEDKREFLLGIQPPGIHNYAFVLGNTRFPVNITGSASITGNVYVGLKGIKPGVLKGMRFKGGNTVNGRIIRDEVSHLPALDLKILNQQISEIARYNKKSLPNIKDDNDHRLELNDGSYFITQKDIEMLNGKGIREIIGPARLISDSELKFSDLKLLNRIAIYNIKESVILNRVITENILVFADKIAIYGPGTLSGQFYAFSSQIIDNGIRLVYPSIAGLICHSDTLKDHLMNIGENVDVEGVLFLFHSENSEKNNTGDRIIVNKTAQVKGFIYSDSYLELYGTVMGSVFAESLYFYSKPTTYINWLKDAKINRLLYNQKPVYPLAFENNLSLHIITEL